MSHRRDAPSIPQSPHKRRPAVLTPHPTHSSITLIECVNNFLRWSGTSIPTVLRAVTSTPAEMLGLAGVKGSLEAGADADLVIFSEETTADGGAVQLVADEVWKFGSRVFHKNDPFSPVYSPVDSSPVPSSPEPEFAL